MNRMTTIVSAEVLLYDLPSDRSQLSITSAIKYTGSSMKWLTFSHEGGRPTAFDFDHVDMTLGISLQSVTF